MQDEKLWQSNRLHQEKKWLFSSKLCVTQLLNYIKNLQSLKAHLEFTDVNCLAFAGSKCFSFSLFFKKHFKGSAPVSPAY